MALEVPTNFHQMNSRLALKPFQFVNPLNDFGSLVLDPLDITFDILQLVSGHFIDFVNLAPAVTNAGNGFLNDFVQCFNINTLYHTSISTIRRITIIPIT